MRIMRRRVVGGLLGVGSALLPGTTLLSRAADATRVAGPGCDNPADTPAQTAGPFFTPDAPRRKRLDGADGDGQTLELAGQIVSGDCRPIAGARLDVWHCDASGRYDNEGFRLRGHVLTPEDGSFRLETIKPGAYGGRFFSRTPHIHVRITPATGAPLTTQLYFPGEPTNDRDSLYDPRLEMSLNEGSEGLVGRYRFVLA
jgi:protocatechuate 3,4-dioxygenase beta subunit